ncbi:MAG: hypothetical protein ABMA02_19515 [Saprospiraceae bacterium]
MKNNILIFAFCLFTAAVYAQKFPEHREKVVNNDGSAVLLHLSGGLHVPGGDFADRFGSTGSFGLGLEWITAKNVSFGLEGHYIFGSDVKEDPLAILRTPEGGIIGNNQLLADVSLRARGIYAGASIGKLFTFGKKRSGIRITLGAGMLQHWIRAQDDGNSVVQITGDYEKGYDRLSGGLALNQFVGWQHLGPDRRSNWFIGLEFNQGFTNTQRDWDFSEMRKLDGNRTDLRFGIRLGWTLPFYQKPADQIYY